MAQINALDNEATKKRLLKKYQKMQREKLGIDDDKLRKVVLVYIFNALNLAIA